MKAPQVGWATGQPEFTDLYLRSADPSVVILPVNSPPTPPLSRAPAFSPDGNLIAFVGSDYDAKGDLYLMDLGSKEKGPKRLTGRETEEGAPVFSPDGKRIYFHQSRPGEEGRRMVVLDLSSPDRIPEVIDTQGDPSFPAVSPDGTKIVFFRDANKNLWTINADGSNEQQLTFGSFSDAQPDWGILSGATIPPSRSPPAMRRVTLDFPRVPLT